MNFQELEIKYTQEFLDEVQEIFNYLTQNASEYIAKKFAKAVDDKTRQIESNPYAYAVEPELPSKRKIYRKAIVMKSWKIVYRITSKRLTILGIIHTARHPSSIRSMRSRH